MKAAELMIGDWVYCEGQPTPENVTIQTIAEDGVWFNGPHYEGAASYDRIFPIPITPEILEKNGFTDGEYKNYCGFVWKYKADGFRKIGFTIQEKQGIIWGEKIKKEYPNAIGDEFSIPGIRYLHELQHALRLCGIDKEIVV